MSATTPLTVVITGASDGIGLESARQLAALGHRVVMVGRNPDKTRAAAASVAAEHPDAVVETALADFASQASVRALAAELLERCERIDVLVNNAGTVFEKRTVTDDGIEATFAVNHLGGFLLTELLLDRILASAPARIVLTSSTGHYQGTMDFDDLGFESGYGIMRAYGRSKLANVLHTRELARRLHGTGVTVNCLHPGTVATSIWGGAPWWARPVLALAKRIVMVSPSEGGRRITYLAVGPEVEGLTGGYYDDDRLKEPSELAQDDATGIRLRDVSLGLVGLPE
ncbi:retinol dehydrogenase [Nocardioides szechwanensis]|uniref:Short-chain dehydrogenase n=1 Tax=Nocardioides szechwanensis TaxID=1005944 RepID=A0A1H0AB31_9ACTN|nr:SDR family oxidoreductase [Nocardioides szechwanensis]GEP34922.1 retinol dehydrogenase [Nocardioides szechwanensis]SDN30183.1 Short-chain dehydrogenase [Nocardioides szechwanensis]